MCKRNWIKSPTQNDACSVIISWMKRCIYLFWHPNRSRSERTSGAMIETLLMLLWRAAGQTQTNRERKKPSGSHRLLKIDCSFMSTNLKKSWKTLRLTATQNQAAGQARARRSCGLQLLHIHNGILERHVEMLQFLMGKEMKNIGFLTYSFYYGKLLLNLGHLNLHGLPPPSPSLLSPFFHLRLFAFSPSNPQNYLVIIRKRGYLNAAPKIQAFVLPPSGDWTTWSLSALFKLDLTILLQARRGCLSSSSSSFIASSLFRSVFLAVSERFPHQEVLW